MASLKDEAQQMKPWIKMLWKDMSEIGSPIFFQKYVLPSVAIFFTLGVIGHLMLITLDLNSLQRNKGEVSDIAVKIETGKNTYYPLYIELVENDNAFRLPDTYKDNFSNLQQKVLINDTITIYTRNSLQTFLGWGLQNDIYQIDKNGETLFSLSKVIDEKKSQAKILAIFSLILWTWYIIYRRKRIDH